MTWNLEIENIAGIRRGDATLERGLNAVRATNWQGKSSFLRAVETAMGTKTPLTEGADEGHVALRTDTDDYRVDLRQANGRVIREGAPYLTSEYDIACASLYAFLGEDNEVRSAVRNGENLKSVLTRPLDFENIDEQIRERKDEREQVEAELARAQDAADELAGIEAHLSDLEERYRELRQRRDEARVERAGDPDGAREQLSEARADRDRLRERVDRLERSIERTEKKLAERCEELDELDVPEGEDIASDLETAREELDRIERDENLLQSVYTANRRVLDEGREELVTTVSRNLVDDELACWVCGEPGDRADFEQQVDALGEKLSEIRERASEYRQRVEELEDRRDRIKRAKRRRTDLEDEISDLETTLEDRRRDLEGVRDRLAEVEERIAELSERVEESDDELAEVEGELRYVETELEELREKRAGLQKEADRIEALESERDALTDEIERLRTRKDDLKRRTREEFDEAIDDILTRFDTSFETARLTPEFDLVVAREGREASLDALSEGEVELLGFVAALAAYEAFEVHDRVPVLLVDRLGGLDDSNLHALVEYLRGRAEYLIFTAYPEHASFDGHDIDPTDWSVVSDGSERPARVD